MTFIHVIIIECLLNVKLINKYDACPRWNLTGESNWGNKHRINNHNYMHI